MRRFWLAALLALVARGVHAQQADCDISAVRARPNLSLRLADVALRSVIPLDSCTYVADGYLGRRSLILAGSRSLAITDTLGTSTDSAWSWTIPMAGGHFWRLRRSPAYATLTLERFLFVSEGLSKSAPIQIAMPAELQLPPAPTGDPSTMSRAAAKSYQAHRMDTHGGSLLGDTLWLLAAPPPADKRCKRAAGWCRRHPPPPAWLAGYAYDAFADTLVNGQVAMQVPGTAFVPADAPDCQRATPADNIPIASQQLYTYQSLVANPASGTLLLNPYGGAFVEVKPNSGGVRQLSLPHLTNAAYTFVQGGASVAQPQACLLQIAPPAVAGAQGYGRYRIRQTMGIYGRPLSSTGPLSHPASDEALLSARPLAYFSSVWLWASPKGKLILQHDGMQSK